MYTGHPPRRRRAGSGPVVLAAAKRILSRRQSHVGVRCHSASFGWPRHHGLWHILVLRVAAVPYGLFGLEIGLLLGQWLTGDIGLLAIILGIVGAVILFGAAYLLEPYRRVLLGLSAGALVGLSIASFFGLDHFVGGVLGAVLAVVGAIIGAIIVPRYFDAFVIVASAFGGAAMVIAGAHWLFPGIGLFDRAAGGFMPAVLTIVLSAVGIGWQFKNIAAWIRSQPLYGDISGASVKDQSGPW